jgi:hypothetical protein
VGWDDATWALPTCYDSMLRVVFGLALLWHSLEFVSRRFDAGVTIFATSLVRYSSGTQYILPGWLRRGFLGPLFSRA